MGTVLAEAGNRHRESSMCEDAGLIGAAYAACHVYCEALNCDSEEPGGSERSCRNALARFEDLTDGATPPCEEPEGMICPCGAAWLGEGFFSQDPDVSSSTCTVDIGSEDHSSLLLMVPDLSDESFSYATLDILRFPDVESSWEYVSCSSVREPVVPGAPDTGAFEMANSYSPGATAVHQFHEAVFAACQADLMSIMQHLMDSYGLECEIVDNSGE
jgi:hypothetical protein